MALPTTNVELTTPVAEQKIVLRPYPTARMQQAQSAIFLRYSKVDVKEAQKQAEAQKANPGNKADNDKVVDISELPGSALQEINQLTVKNFVLSIDGNEYGGDKDAILEACLDMHTSDFQAILDRCNEINAEAQVDDAKKAK